MGTGEMFLEDCPITHEYVYNIGLQHSRKYKVYLIPDSSLLPQSCPLNHRHLQRVESHTLNQPVLKGGRCSTCPQSEQVRVQRPRSRSGELNTDSGL